MRTKMLKKEICHIYLRGVDKQKIFKDENDYKRFKMLLNFCNKKNRMSFSEFLKKKDRNEEKFLNEKKEDYANIIIQTLMPNHFHSSLICLGNGYISKYMQKVLDSYTRYFNIKYKRKGHLFECKYEFRRITDDHDLQNTIDYIYNNPAKLLDKNYNHKDFLNGNYKMSKKQKGLLKWRSFFLKK